MAFDRASWYVSAEIGHCQGNAKHPCTVTDLQVLGHIEEGQFRSDGLYEDRCPHSVQ